MNIGHTIADIRSQVATWKGNGQKIAFVPTMGNLHAGHLALVTAAKQRADRVVVSIFVNPLQFGPNEDFAKYPRTLEADTNALRGVGADLLFLPEVGEIYPQGQQAATKVEVSEVSEGLCGAFRPGHFAGVATVVTKLFNIVQPDLALFGKKDYQQLQVIRRMVADLCFPIEIIGLDTVREPNGLAMSSRNGYLSSAEREQAVVLYRSLKQAVDRLRAGDQDYARIEATGMAELQAHGFRPDYFSIRRADNLATVEVGKPLVVLVAAWLGGTRLIDNVEV
ncbi:MAG: pantoate--beta-alanine ligase [Gammaproteobacteria bacterium]|nr:pantoate--beta-alanine ligase [Gammaproteobacteria bacterium]